MLNENGNMIDYHNRRQIYTQETSSLVQDLYIFIVEM